MRRRILATGWMIAALCMAGGASAQPADAIKRADDLFKEGRKLLDQGKAAEACPKFEESQRLDPGLGTLLNLADCYERTDRLASALTAFRAAEEQAHSMGEKKREVAASDRARSLESRVSRVTIVLAPGERPAGFAVTRNGAAVAPVDFGRPIAVDPGTVTIEATAPGQQPFTTSVEITTARSAPQLEIPPLAPITTAVEHPTDPVDPPPRVTTVDPGKGRRRLGLIVGAAGGAGLGAGIVIGLLASSKYHQAIEDECGGNRNNCSPAGIEHANAARTRGTIGTVVGGVGVAALVAGAVLYLTAPSAHTVEVAPTVTADGAGVTLTGSF